MGERFPGRKHGQRRLIAIAGAVLVAAGALTACGSDSGTTINLYLAPEESFQKVVDKCNAQAGNRYNIVFHKLPRDADGQREQMVRRLAAGDTEVDLLGLDVTSVPEFAEAKWIVEWTGANKQQASEGVLPGPQATATWNGKLYAATKNTNVQLLWYDAALLKQANVAVPTTFDEMIAAAQKLKSMNLPYQVLLHGAQYEGMLVHYNSAVASANGKVISDDGKSVVMDAGAVKGLEVLKKLATAGVTSPSLDNAKEENVQKGFEAAGSQAAFELNWPYVYASIQKNNPERAKNFQYARYPGVNPGQPSRTAIGGFNLAVSAHSKHQAEAFDAALCLRSKESQKYSALADAFAPTIESIYTDESPMDIGGKTKTMREAYPMKEKLLEELKDPAVRPLTPAYQNVSTVLQTHLAPFSDIDLPGVVEKLRKELADALQSKGVLP
ncbi:multiple sugar transport system substrate-binding protein [Herbihabitans rhizosphaerae]|uniref:Multiple sugar transport system substrate-binding protein n=1 Tax=Herbihabitans rhizosphaerae TaxID=1872711 RepID=A0A4Q7L6N2_9PSEU|nr:ABC transporter substrate-binding protein [Herbihabitans rhizosphaerae]RZS44261.1 multiple sugar transport system substrate-binding protein [Herbihabitans rhizosphaerae]